MYSPMSLQCVMFHMWHHWPLCLAQGIRSWCNQNDINANAIDNATANDKGSATKSRKRVAVRIVVPWHLAQHWSSAETVTASPLASLSAWQHTDKLQAQHRQAKDEMHQIWNRHAYLCHKCAKTHKQSTCKTGPFPLINSASHDKPFFSFQDHESCVVLSMVPH